MKSSFPAILAAVLGNQPVIAELPNDNLVAFNCEGNSIDGEVSPALLLKVVRLQTLISQAQEDAEMPSTEAIQQIADETNVEFFVASINASHVQEDATHRMMLLERLIVEVVREACPAECGQFDVQYLAHISRKIIRRPINKRFNDSTW